MKKKLNSSVTVEVCPKSPEAAGSPGAGGAPDRRRPGSQEELGQEQHSQEKQQHNQEKQQPSQKMQQQEKENQRGKYQNCHLVLIGSFLFFLPWPRSEGSTMTIRHPFAIFFLFFLLMYQAVTRSKIKLPHAQNTTDPQYFKSFWTPYKITISGAG